MSKFSLFSVSPLIELGSRNASFAKIIYVLVVFEQICPFPYLRI